MIYFDAFGDSNKKLVLNIVRRSLGYIDERLIDHGERVAYIADRIASMDPGLDIDRDLLLVLCLLHDIGAYKTEEIDDMVQFEMNSLRHAMYGYVFLRNTTALGDRAEAILYHHTRYDELPAFDTPYKTMAQLIFLADRIDILLLQPGPPDWQAILRLSGSVFSPALVELFFAAEAKYDISGHVRDDSFRPDILRRIEAVDMSEDAVFSYLKMLVYSIDFRSPFTVTHTANTVVISTVLAEMFGLDEDERNDIALGAFLHDVGKIAIPYAILENPGKLSGEQMELMKTHVAYSDEILSGVVPDPVCRIAVRHHEKLNGSGYHCGLDASALTLSERIVAVSDILSALINRRSYKEPFPKETAIAILEEMRDAGELCPRVCAMVIERYDTIMDIIALKNDPVVALYERIQKQYAELLADMPEAS